MIIVAAAALIAGGLLYFRARRTADGSAPSGGGVYGSMDAYTASAQARPNHPVVFIGLDGASWPIIDTLIATGDLPVMQRLKAGGSWGTLRSVDCYFTPPAWTSMLSGYRPERTGIYTFGKWSGEGDVFQSVSALDIAVPRVWDVASAAGKRVAVTGVPVTYPAGPVNGIMVSGLMAPITYTSGSMDLPVSLAPLRQSFHDLDRRTYSPPVFAQTNVTNQALVFALYDTSDDRVTSYDTAVLKIFPVNEVFNDSLAVVVRAFNVGEWSPWFQIDFRTFSEPAKRVFCAARVVVEKGAAVVTLTPMTRLPSDPELRMTQPAELGREIEERFGFYHFSLAFEPELIPRGTEEAVAFASYFYDYDDWDLFMHVFQAPDNIQHHEGVSDRTREVYRTIDRFLGGVIDRLPEDATLVLASDHGFKKYRFLINLNAHFQKWGLLGDLPHIDFKRTLVFHDRWCVYFNKKLLTRDELERRGIAVPGGSTPRQALVAYLNDKARTIENPFEDGRLMPIDLVEVPKGAVGSPPDMVVIGGYSDYFVVASDLKIRNPALVAETGPRMEWYHAREGMYLFWGSQVKAGLDGGVKNIEDVAPTLLYLMDLPLATDFDGTIMDDILREDVAQSRRKAYLKDYAALTPSYDFSYEDLQSLEEKLRTLGYIR
jgi:predicted AlkP superfamily phosphohydrolase/phosphomutase